jgi:hypothetical protein
MEEAQTFDALAGVVLEHLEATILEVLREQNPGTIIKREEIFLAGRFSRLEYTSPKPSCWNRCRNFGNNCIARVSSVRGPTTSRTD